MRFILFVFFTPLFFNAALTAETTRYGIHQDLKSYPQNSPRDCLGSVLKSIKNKRFDYLLAHLIHPDLVKIELGNQSFKELVSEVTENFRSGRKGIALLKRIYREGEIIFFGNQAAVLRLKNGRQLQFLAKDKIWYLNRH